ncbi:Crp/Fnr family transcriptional regulator [Dyadobacter crusticola]|uniref:Crp/Fnr family transcriptional regulator n=1 Tax=Dyadobacter crusticola TaxID=292407 RepID=UPI00068F8390|nr:Crp/Fnr family transcriptional regulator [Dyadobacter crusticola]
MFAGCLESFIQQAPSLQSLEPTEILVLRQDGLEKLYKELPETHVIMRKVMEQRFIASQRLLASYILSNPQQRYEWFAQQHPHLVQRVPQYILASFIGITPVSLSRIWKRISSGN